MKKLIWHFVHELFYLFLLPFDLVIPKCNDYWVFALKQNMPWGDSLRSVFEYAQNEDGITPIILTNGSTTRDDIISLYPNAMIFRRMSLMGIWYFLRSKVCFIGYTNKELYSMLVPHFRHTVINLWHGIPIKAIALGEKSCTKLNRKILNPHYKFCNYYIASSKIDRLAMSACMMQNPNLFWITGLPRNDLLYSETTLPNDLQKEEENIKNILNGRKLILYAPTFRDWSDNVNPLSDSNVLTKLVSVAKEYNAAIGIRKHPLDSSFNIKDHPDIIDCSSEIFSNAQILLRNAECLITDYSGIWIDYLLLDRPIIGFCYDYERYMTGRSFLYDFEHVFPGDIVKTTAELEASLESTLKGEDAMSEKRAYSRDIFFSYTDNKSTDRVINKVKELL